ncbi:Gfo/Idh/MocA family oxidoreductase [Gramella sp. AN32]|uniref:Gfo/Idh/MocA family protein n=1 Tax=Christiangramia antarctica TaxID=2058158 RepID=A0ABW5X297_9FLAO|nr:Gfo/Idh/MocA family oxidoreductase [Gramella sp. AN32]MCM4157123.1 gfo/Idh/MocA family oxidoreductase [Gramella sp. AN32]
MILKTKKVRIGVLGTANIAIRALIPAMDRLPELYDFRGIATRNKKKPSLAKEPYNIIQGYENMLEDGLDAVYIPLPNSLHFQWVRNALDRGLHVLVEKSLACNLSEVEKLNDIAKKNDLALVENFQFRFHPQLKYILDIIEKGTLGELRYVRSSFCFPPFQDKDNIRYNKDLGGGALLDAGAYPVKISQIILGQKVEVTSASLNYSDDFEVDLWGSATLEQKQGGVISQINFGFDNYYQCNIEILGTEGKLYTNRIFTAGDRIKPSILLETKSKGLEHIELPSSNHFINMLEYFNEVIGSRELRKKEYLENKNQSRLLQEIKQKANG